MLKEIARRDAASRRWFTSDLADLYVWQDEAGRVDAFEYCYRIRAVEFSLRWHHARGIEHARVDDGEPTPLKNNSPITIATLAPDWGRVIEHFREQSATLDAGLQTFILHKLYQAACSEL